MFETSKNCNILNLLQTLLMLSLLLPPDFGFLRTQTVDPLADSDALWRPFSVEQPFEFPAKSSPPSCGRELVEE